MRSFIFFIITISAITIIPWACVDPLDQSLSGTVNVIVVDGMINNLAEPQLIRLNRSQADRLTGRFGTLPIKNAQVEVIEDSSRIIACHETVDGSYQLPSDFKGQIGHTYQLRFTLSDGTRYQSDQQTMPPVPPIDKVSARFNLKSVIPPFVDNVYTAGHDLFIDFKDPANQRNYYRWDWTLYEPQEWCRSCYESLYIVDSLIDLYTGGYGSTDKPFEDCFAPPLGSIGYLQVKNSHFEYPCRTQCWEIIHSHDIIVFDDQYSNGGFITQQPVAHIPFYQHSPCLVDIRQEALTKDAYNYFRFLQQQTQNTGGLADSPPTVLAGNVHNVSNNGYLPTFRENVSDYWT